jgi:hypothetical protein
MRCLMVVMMALVPVLARGADCASTPSGELRLDESAGPAFQEELAAVESWILACGPVNVQVRVRTPARSAPDATDGAASAEAAVNAFFDEIFALAAVDEDQLNRRPFHLEPAVIVNEVDATLLAALLASASVERVIVMEASSPP